MDYVKKLDNICDQLIRFFGWETPEEQERKFQETGSRVSHGDDHLQKMVFEGKSLMNTNYAVAITQLYNSIAAVKGYRSSFADYVVARGARDFEQDRIDQLYNYICIIGELVELYNKWDEDQFKPIIDTIQNHSLFKSKSKAPEVTPQLIQRVHDLIVTKNAFQIYKYREGSGKIKSTDSWNISSEIGFSQDLTQWLGHVNNQKEFLNKQSDDEVFVTLFGKIDELSDLYSNWVITLHKKDTVWLITDQVSFHNPTQKRGRLGRESVWKDADDMAELCDLPYYIFDNLDDLRKSQTGLVSTDKYEQEDRNYLQEARDELGHLSSFNDGDIKYFNHATHLMKVDLGKKNLAYDICYPSYKGGSFAKLHFIEARNKGRVVARWEDGILRVYRSDEFLFMKMDDLDEQAKLFMLLIPGKLIEVISSQGYETPRVMLSGEFVETKLLEGGVIRTADPEHLRYWEDQHQRIFKGLLDTLERLYGHSSALMPQSYASITKTDMYDTSWLSTMEQHESLSEWLIAEQQLSLIRPRWLSLRNREKEDKQALYKLMNSKYDEILGRIMGSKDATFYDNVDVTDGGSFGGSYTSNGKFQQGGGFTTVNRRATVESKSGFGLGKTIYGPERCKCNNYDSKDVKVIHITHFRELMWVIGCRVEELPPYYQNFRGYRRTPYNGNSLLDQVHPFADLEDPCSRSNSNGIALYVYMCGNCIKKLNTGPDHKEIKVTTKLKKFL